MAVLPWRLKALTRRAQTAIHTTASSGRGYEARVAATAPPLNARDALMILIAFSDLRVRGPEVQPVCLKCSVIIASSLRRGSRGSTSSFNARSSKESAAQTNVSVDAVGEVAVALASLQARHYIPVLKKALLPKLLQLNGHDHNERFLQRVGFSLVKLGSEQVDGAVSDHVLSLLLEYVTQFQPNDHVAFVTASALASLPNGVIASSIKNMSTATTDQRSLAARCTAQVTNACRSFYSATVGGNADAVDRLLSTTVLALQPYLSRAATADALPLETAMLLTLLLTEKLSSAGVVQRATGNGVFQLLHTWLPLCDLYRELSLALQQQQQQQGQGLSSSVSVEIGAALATIQRAVQDLPLTKCVPGGFATFMHASLWTLTHSNTPSSSSTTLATSVPFVKRLLWAAADPEFAKAFNSYDVAKLADALRQGAWDAWVGIEISNPNSTNTAANVAAGEGQSSSQLPAAAAGRVTLGHLLVEVTGRFTDDLKFFVTRSRHHSHSHSSGGNSDDGAVVKYVDGVSVSSVLRTQLRILQCATSNGISSRALSRSRRFGITRALQAQMKEICVACTPLVKHHQQVQRRKSSVDGGVAGGTKAEDVASVDGDDDVGMPQWSRDSIPWMLKVLSNVLLFDARVLQPRQLSAKDSMKAVRSALTSLAEVFNQHLESAKSVHQDDEGKHRVVEEGDDAVGIREAVMALHVGSTVLNLSHVHHGAWEGAELERRTLLRMCLLTLDAAAAAGQSSWSQRVIDDWSYLPLTERSAVLHSIGMLSSIVSANDKDGSDVETMAQQLVERAGLLGDSFLRHVATQQGRLTFEQKQDSQVDETTAGDCDSSDNSQAVIQGGLDSVAVVDALCAVFSWIGTTSITTKDTTATSSRHAAMRALFMQLLQLPENTIPPESFVRLLDAMALHRHALFPQAFYPSSSVVILRSDVKRLWERQMFSLVHSAPRTSSSSSASSMFAFAQLGSAASGQEAQEQPLRRASVDSSVRGVAHTEMTLIARAAASLKLLGFTLVAAVAAATPPKPQQNRTTLTKPQDEKRRIIVPFSAAVDSCGGVGASSTAVLDEAVQLAALVFDQRDRLRTDELQAWGRELNPYVARGIPLLSSRGIAILLRALRSPEALGLLIPRHVDRERLVERCLEQLDSITHGIPLVGEAVPVLATLPEVVELAEGFAVAPHLESLLATTSMSSSATTTAATTRRDLIAQFRSLVKKIASE